MQKEGLYSVIIINIILSKWWFKISIDENEQIEKLEFKNYILKIDYEI